MFGFIKKMFFTAIVLFSYNTLNVIPLKCISMNNKKCRVGPEILNINRNEPSFYLDSILVNKCSGSCNNINNPYAKLCIDMNINVFNLMSITNKARHIQ